MLWILFDFSSKDQLEIQENENIYIGQNNWVVLKNLGLDII